MSRQAIFPGDPFTPETSGLIASSPASFVLAYRPSYRARRLICIIYATGWNFTDKVPSIRLTPIRCHATKGQRGYGRLRPGRITSGASTPALRSLKRSLAFLERHDVRRLSSSANVLEQGSSHRVGPAQDEPGLARFLVHDPGSGVPDPVFGLSARARTPFLKQQVFEPEVIRALGIAYANACKSLNLIDRTDPQPNRLVRTVLARSIAPPQPIPVGYQLWERHATAGKTARSGASAPRRAGTNQSWRRLLASPLNQPII